MRSSVLLVVFLILALGVAGLAAAYTKSPAPQATSDVAVEPGQVKLAVLIVFDQLRGDYLENWRGLFGPDGFVRMQRDGAWFTHCYYPYSVTTTGPGHASILSGTCADQHGIINNNWFEHDAMVYCAGSTKYTIVPPLPPDPKATRGKPKDAGTPENLLAETVADVLREQKPDSKVFGLSLKDRSAILPTGKHPSGAYWFDGRFVTSTYYADGVSPWVAQFNSLAADGQLAGANKWFGKDWLPGSDDYVYRDWLKPQSSLKPADSSAAPEPVFRHPNTGGKPKPGKDYYENLAKSPAGNELLLELAKTCITVEKLGQRAAPDLLVVSFSSNDLIGHAWGPDSPEVLDVTIRSDAIVTELLNFLDAQVGKGKYLLALTADHGVCPSVNASRDRGMLDAEQVNIKKLQEEVDNHLTERFAGSLAPKTGEKKPLWVEAFGKSNSDTFPWMYFNPAVAERFGKSRPEVAQAAAEFLAHHPQVARTFTRSQLENGSADNDVIAHRVLRSFHRQRSGDVYVLLRPYCIPGEGDFTSTKTTHGTPYNYDTHVPLLVYGPGVRGGVRPESTAPQATAAIFSRWLGLRQPNKAEFPIPSSLLEW